LSIIRVKNHFSRREKEEARGPLFFRLSSYAPRPGRTAREDFLTEVFAAVPTGDPEAVTGLLRHATEIARIAGAWRL
jgi:hypothetical protein